MFMGGKNTKSEPEKPVGNSALGSAIRLAIDEAVAEDECLLDYPELARRLRLGVRATKNLVNRGKITPTLRYANVARFHWPSVLRELKKPAS
jgi:hypothetical protein